MAMGSLLVLLLLNYRSTCDLGYRVTPSVTNNVSVWS